MEKDENQLLSLDLQNPQLIRKVQTFVRQNLYKKGLLLSHASDIQQNVFIKLLKMDNFARENIKNPEAYLRTIVRNEINTHLTREISREEIQLEENLIENAFPIQANSNSIIETQQILSQIWVELSKSEQEILYLLIFDYNQKQMAIRLRISHDTVRQRVHRLRKKLQQLLNH